MVTRLGTQLATSSRFLLAFAVLQVALCATSLAEGNNANDIKSFKLLDISSYFRTGYLFDERERSSAGAGDFQAQSSWEEEFFILSKSFVYHPGFLNMEFGGGPLFVQQPFESQAGKTSNNESLFNLLGRLNFLELKKYPISLYYERSHPSVTMSLAGRFITQNDVYGASGSISEMFGKSTTMQYTLETRTTDGGALGWTIDDMTDKISLKLETGYRNSGRLKFLYNQFDTQSASGSPNLPLYRSNTSQELKQLEARNRFGANGRLRLLQILRHMKHETEAQRNTARDDRRYTADVQLKITDKLRSYLRYRRGDVRHTDFGSETQGIELGLIPRLSGNLQLNVSGAYNSAGQNGFSRDVSTMGGALSYARKLGFGVLGISGSVRGSRTDQESNGESIAAVDEAHVLNGTMSVSLANEFVIAGSTTVSNQPRTQTFVEGLDYRLVVVGSTTSIERLIDGNINDGEAVVVDYSYESTGTVEFDSLHSGVALNISFLNNFNAYLRYDIQDTDLREGAFNNPINDRNSLEVGASISNQFLDGWGLSGHFRHRDQDEEISPFTSDNLDVSLTRTLRGTWRLTVASGVAIVDYETSAEDIERYSYRFGINGRVFGRAQLTYDVAYSSDAGGSLPRKQLHHRFQLRWAYRRVRVSLSALYSEDEQGATNRTDSQVIAQLTRAF